MDRFHSLSHEQAASELMACCAARSWAARVSGLRPFPDREALVATGRKLAEQLSWPEVLEALSAHPRIGQRLASPASPPESRPESPSESRPESWPESPPAREADWSRQEQSGVSAGSHEAFIAGNAAYEARFGHIFLICATGLSGEQMLAELASRLDNEAAREQAVVRRELAKIVELRLRKLVTT